jgi:amidase
VSFPTGIKVDKDVDVLDASYQPLSPLCKSVNDDCKYPTLTFMTSSRLTNTLQDDAALVHGLPVSLQIVARRLEEEKVLAMAELVHETMI